MSTPPPGYRDYPSPGYPPLGSGPPGYPPFGYPPSGYGPPPAYGQPTGYGGPAQLIPGAFRPGIIPLRPLSLTDIFNGAVGYIRANPKTTLGLTAAIVVIMQLLALALKAWPLTVAGTTDTSSELTSRDAAVWMLSLGASALVTWLGGILLSGILTVIVGRAVFGSTITIGEAWTKIRGRLLALTVLAALEAVGAISLVVVVMLIVATVAIVANAAAAFLFGFSLVLALIATLGYLYTVLSFAPALIVLERLNIIDAITRSVALVRNSFWRVLGIRLLTSLVVTVVGFAIAAPFTIVGQLLLAAAPSTGPLLIGAAVSAVGSAIAAIITTPFSAGVVVLLYTDRRIRAEAFDFVLQTGAAGGPAATASTDHLWLIRPV